MIPSMAAFFIMHFKEFKNGKTRLYSNGDLVGSIWIIDLQDISAYICKLVIKDEYQNLGFGKILLDHAIEKASKCKSVRLHVSIKNTDAIRFYEREGFFICAKTNKPKNDPHYLMCRRVTCNF